MQRYTLIMEVNKSYTVSPGARPFEIASYLFDQNKHVESEEVLTLLSLDSQSNIIATFEVARGSTSETITHAREIFKRVILSNASAFVLAHNHPACTLNPSRADMDFTRRIVKAGKLLSLPLVDHIIITPDKKYLSIRSEEQSVFE